MLQGGVFPMTVPRSFMQLTLVAVMCFGPVMTEAASLQQAQAVSVGEDGPEHRSVLKHSESRPTVHQLQPEQIQRSILRVLEQEMAGKVRAIHAVGVDPLDPMTIPSGGIELRVSPHGLEEGLGRRA